MRRSSVIEKWRSGGAASCSLVKLADPRAAEIAALMGIDCLWLDLEHNGSSVETAENLMRAARCGGADVMARPAKGEFMRMGRLLEAGAQGILYPRCETAEEARELVRWAKFAPLGERGVDGGNADAPYGLMTMPDYIKAANENTFIFAQIESPSALQTARAIAEVEGIDGLFFGPGDFSVLSGIPGQFESGVVRSAMKKVCADALAAGKRFGTLTFNAEQARRVLDMGGTFICQGCDIAILRDGFGSLRKMFESLGIKGGSGLSGPSGNLY